MKPVNISGRDRPKFPFLSLDFGEKLQNSGTLLKKYELIIISQNY